MFLYFLLLRKTPPPRTNQITERNKRLPDNFNRFLRIGYADKLRRQNGEKDKNKRFSKWIYGPVLFNITPTFLFTFILVGPYLSMHERPGILDFPLMVYEALFYFFFPNAPLKQYSISLCCSLQTLEICLIHEVFNLKFAPSALLGNIINCAPSTFFTT